ncbi:MAG: hypothetical protein WCI67_13465 [Chloroflexales bacterium]
MKTTNTRKARCAQVLETVSVAKGRVRLIPFDRNAWFQCVYATIQRTLPQGAPQIAREHLQRDLFAAVDALSDQPPTADAFEPWIAGTIQTLAATYALSIGQSQRLINTLLMYHYCSYHAERDLAWNAAHQFIRQHGPLFHVPIDHHVLIGLKVTYDCPDVHINRERTSATVRVGDALVSWSRLDDLPVYIRIQRFAQDIKDNHLQAFDTTLDLAMSELAGTP